MTTPTPYGLCPVCGQPGFARERRPNGNDTCPNGHTYPSRDAVADKSMTTPTPCGKLWSSDTPTPGAVPSEEFRIKRLREWAHQAKLRQPGASIIERTVAEDLMHLEAKYQRDLAASEAELAAMKQGKVLADGMANMIRGFILKTVERETLDEAAAKYRKWEEDYCHSTPAKLDRAIAAEQRAEAAERARDSYCEKFNRQCEEADEQTRQRMAAERKAEEAARDSARLDWMIEHGTDEGGGSGFEFRVYIPHDSECLRDAIDAVLAAKGEA